MANKKQLEKLLKFKKSKEWYADKLGTSVARVNELLNEIRGKDETGIYTEKVEENGDKQVEFTSDKPLNREQIEKLYGIDGIGTRLATYWNKQLPSGKYLISALIKCEIEDFYSQEELEAKLKDIFPKVEPKRVHKAENPSDSALFVYLADDHCGNDMKNSIYGKEYKASTYLSRLEYVADGVIYSGIKHKDLFIVNLGDEVDGWNKQTTRGGHELDSSLSNKEQFDIYTESRKKFYDEIFASGVAENYTVINLNNSNHSGNDLSYIINKSLEFYITARYPEVTFKNVEKFIDVIEYGKHVFAYCHGKDEKLMKSPFPLNLDSKTDLWLFEFFDKLGYSPNDYYTHTIKGDLHKYNVNIGKSGRYVNVPSVAGGSTWIELNFGDSRAGALMEIVQKESPNIASIPIWFN